MSGLFDLGALMGAAGGIGRPVVFEETYRCYSMAMSDKPALETGDKIILPHSALDSLTTMHVQYPMMFRMENPSQKRRTHVGVSEFTAVEGRCYVPHWIMQNLLLPEGGFIVVRNVQLPKARFVKFQPHSKDFIDISNPRAVLERQLRAYSALTKGDTLMLTYAKKNYYLDVLECKPADAVSIIETDVEVDFAPPKDYVEPARVPSAGASASSSSSSTAAGAGGASGTAFAPSAGAGKSATGRGTAEAPIVIDDDDAPSSFASAGAGGGAGAASSASAAAGAGGLLSAAGFKPAFIGGSGTVGGAPASGATAMSLAAQAALKRAASAAGRQGPPPSKFAKEPAVVPFAGPAYKLSSSVPEAGSSSGAGFVGGGASESKGDASGSSGAVLGKSVSAGGVLLSTGARPGSAKPRTLNKFEQARADKAFTGEGKTIRD